MTAIAVAMLASAVATTAWNFGRSEDDPQAATTAAAQVPVPSAAAGHRTTPQPAATPLRARPHTAGTAGSLQAATSPSAVVRPARTAPNARRSPQPEAQPYGPWQCSQGFAFDLGTKTPLGPKPCQMLGHDIRYQASLTAPGGATGSISISLQDAGSGHTVAGPKTCAGLTFTGDTAATAGCGPSVASPPRGHQYAVVMAYRYIKDGRTLISAAKGSTFTW